MTRGALAIALSAALVAGAAPVRATANGATQREVQGLVVSVDAAAGTLVVAREFRGRSVRVTLKVAPAIRVFECAGEHAGLGRVKAGMTVSAFYEVAGAGGIANLIVIEPSR